MPQPFETDRAALVQRNPWILGLAASPLMVAGVLLVSGLVLSMPQLFVVLPHLFGLGVFLTIFAWRKNSSPREVPGKLVAGDEGVRLGGELVVAKRELMSAVVLPRGDAAPIVRLRRKGLRLAKDVRVGDREEGRAVLRALGFDASQSVATFLLPSRMLSDPGRTRRHLLLMFPALILFAVLAAAASRVFPAAAPVLPVLWGLLIVGGAVTAMVPSTLRVGADGLHLRWLRTSRFFPYGDIDRIDCYEDPGRSKNAMAGISLRLKSGEVVRMPVQARLNPRDELNILYERISQAVETWSRGEGVAHAALVRRGGRDAAEWVRALRGLGAFANVDARTAPVLPEKLWRIVEDPAAPPDARAGAAVALGLSGDDEARVRLRAAAAATAAPKLRIAIESAAKGEADDALLTALAEIEAQETPAQRA